MLLINLNMKKRNFFLFLLNVLILFHPTGCDSIKDTDQDRQIAISFTAEGLSGTLLKSAASSDEKIISKILLFGVDENRSEVIHTFKSTSSDTSIILSRKVKWLYAIANPSADIEETTFTTVSQLIDLTGDFTVAPVSPFLMSGIAELPYASASVNINLVRAVAKIEIVNTETDFVIESVTVDKTPAKGYVFSRTSLSVPTSSRVTYFYSADDLAINSSIYVAENNSNQTEFAVIGKFRGIRMIYIFGLTSNGGQNVEIKRNTCYQVDISFESDE